MGRTKTFNREDVLKEAIQLFWKKGYADTSLSDLEKATGVNKSGLYSEFKDKDDIFLESLKYYRDNNPAYSLLERQPLGWKNIEDFLEGNLSCKGQKGCFCANTTREYSIIPPKVKSFMEENNMFVFNLVLQNVKATKPKKDPEMLTRLILTFTTGISLKLNAVKPEVVRDEIQAFLGMVKD